MRAIEERYAVESAANWREVTRRIPQPGAPRTLLADPYDEEGPGLATPLQTILQLHPEVTVIAVVPKQIRSTDILTLGRWGVLDLVHPESATPVSLRRVLSTAVSRPLVRVLERAVFDLVSPSSRVLLTAAAAVVTERQGAGELALRLHLSQRTLTRQFDILGLPPARSTLGWLRILWAAELLDDPGQSIASIAHRCGYATESGLRSAFYRFLGANPTELRRAGAVRTVAAAFRQELRA